jgi:glycosyltransferase involved in cell wall biosynthesis
VKLVFLNPSGQLGGAERSLLDILVSLRAAEPEWALRLVVTGEGPLVVRAEALGVPTTLLPFPAAIARLGDGGRAARGGALLAGALRSAPAGLGYLRRLRRLMRELDPDVIHSNGFKMHLLGCWSRPQRARIVWHVHDFVGRRPLMSLLLRRHASRCAAVVANSRSVAADVTAWCGARLPVHPVYNAVDVVGFAPAGEVADLDALAGLEPPVPDVVRIGLVATFAWWKGHETFLRAVSLLPAELPIRAYVIGDALYETRDSQVSREQLRALAERLGISERVAFTGFVDDPATAMRALDVVVHASTEPEPFGLVIVEAMACGRAVVASAAGGAAELISPGENALAHRPGDAAELALRIEAAVRDGGLRRRLGEAGRATAVRLFDRARLADQLVPIYRQVAGSPD